ncbi:hypothetical protein ABPG77_005914 [Micractinium sp. CCAP 211/92]
MQQPRKDVCDCRIEQPARAPLSGTASWVVPLPHLTHQCHQSITLEVLATRRCILLAVHLPPPPPPQAMTILCPSVSFVFLPLLRFHPEFSSPGHSAASPASPKPDVASAHPLPGVPCCV